MALSASRALSRPDDDGVQALVPLDYGLTSDTWRGMAWHSKIPCDIHLAILDDTDTAQDSGTRPTLSPSA